MSFSCSGLSVSLSDRQVVADVSFASEKSEMIGLIGPNGAGKSSLMRAIMGIVPSAGDIAIEGHKITSLRGNDIARLLAYLPQERVVHWSLRVREIVMLGRLPYRSGWARASKEDYRAVDNAIELMDLDAFSNRAFDELSGGEQARVLIARMVAQQAATLIADEPTNGLDPAHQIGLMRMFREFVSQGKTVLVSLHDLALASQWCDRILILDQGHLVADGQARTIMTEERMEAVYGVRIANVDWGGRSFVVPTDMA